MDEKSFISPVVDIFRAILYDIVGLFLPGAALLLVLRESSFAVIRHFVEPLTKIENNTKLALFIGASYVAGYAVQGFGGRFWSLIVVRIVNGAKTWWRDQKLRKPHNRVNEEEHNPHEVVQAGAAQQLVKGEEGMKGISPAFLQVKSQLESSELFRSLRTQIGEYCDVATPDKLSSNEVQNLAYSVADDRAANAFTFSKNPLKTRDSLRSTFANRAIFKRAAVVAHTRRLFGQLRHFKPSRAPSTFGSTLRLMSQLGLLVQSPVRRYGGFASKVGKRGDL